MPHYSSHKAGTLSWADLGSTDAATARAFYSAVMGWEYEVLGAEFGYYANAKYGGHFVAGIGGKMLNDTKLS